MATINVKDAAGTSTAIEKPNANGRAAAAASRPIALATEDKAALDAIAPISAIVAVTPSGTAFAVSRALIASADMTANLTVGGADIDNVPLNRGINPIAATKVRAVTGGTVMRAN